jgi:hypothetical protein
MPAHIPLSSDGIKSCTKCKLSLPHTDFGYCARTKTRLQSWCKRCRSKDARRFELANKERVKSVKRNGKLKRAYGITQEDYLKYLTDQDGVCAICGDGPGVKGVFDIDHNHETGQYRGLLCHPCNCVIGHFKESTTLLESAISYLTAPPGKQFTPHRMPVFTRDGDRRAYLGERTYNQILARQNSSCAICKGSNYADLMLALDHCHILNIVRGLLCQSCNMGLGFAKDSKEILQLTASYLSAHQ